MPAGSDAFQPMFRALQKTALGTKHGTITATSIAAGLYVSTQFTRTVSVNEPNDNFLRPCHWVLWSCMSEIGLLVSPEEANALIPILRHTSLNQPTCHLIVYSAPITRRMLQFNNLDYYSIPPLTSSFKAPTWLRVQLGIFAGRLYFERDEYDEIMSYLGIQAPRDKGEDFVQLDRKETFAAKPLAFLHEWLAIRRKGQDFEHTPMGFITTGKPLSAEHPFFAATENGGGGCTEVQPAPRPIQIKEDDDDDDESDDGEDHAKEHLFQHNDSDDGHEVFHDVEEEFGEEFVQEGNMFFDGKAYVPAEDEDEKEE